VSADPVPLHKVERCMLRANVSVAYQSLHGLSRSVGLRGTPMIRRGQVRCLYEDDYEVRRSNRSGHFWCGPYGRSCSGMLVCVMTPCVYSMSIS
jgi:hypothetical protein